MKFGAREIGKGVSQDGGVLSGGESGGLFAEGARFLFAVPFAQPILVAAVFAFEEVGFIEVRVAFGGEPFDDGAVGSPIVETRVKFVANVPGKTGDFAAAFAGGGVPAG